MIRKITLSGISTEKYPTGVELKIGQTKIFLNTKDALELANILKLSAEEECNPNWIPNADYSRRDENE